MDTDGTLIYYDISIHAPLAGCDVRLERPPPLLVISIHAPLAGCDRDRAVAAVAPGKFQSTHPLRGATALVLTATAALPVFQSTRPLRGATKDDRDQGRAGRISIHAPLAGRDPSSPLTK